ncbi:YcaO-like family protein [Hyalangium versicolor]|uniref:YcaO-like family protein n=1 Tax=Hyalangium versicolor TaxID=2861190 RepID=UPI001CCE96E2|nr:YcaO-like family protein [Hyalangium versicolor]
MSSPAIAAQGSLPINLFGVEHRARKQRFGGTDRTRSPTETVAEWKPAMRRFGITRLADITGLDRIGVPVVVAVRPAATTLATSQGKGMNLDAAMASALMEAIETWHAENLDAPVRYATHDEMRRRHPVIDVSLLKLVRERRRISAHHSNWIAGWDILREGPSWVPLDCVALTPRPFPSQFCRLNTTGLASGNHMLEALCHALYEVIERDAVTGALFGAARRRVDLDGVRNPVCRALMDRLRAADVDVIAWDVTCDTGVPTFAARVVDRGEHGNFRPTFPGAGSGTHLTPSVALHRALTEALQDRLCRIGGARDDITRAQYVKALDMQAQQELLDLIAREPVVCALDDLPDRATDTFEGDVRVLTEALRAANVPEAVVVDVSRAEVGMPVIRVVVPALENAPAERTLPPGSRWAGRTSARARW